MLYLGLPALHVFYGRCERYFIKSKFFRSTECKGREAKQPFVKVSPDFSSRLGGLESRRVLTNGDEAKSKDFQHSTRSLLCAVPALSYSLCIYKVIC